MTGADLGHRMAQPVSASLQPHEAETVTPPQLAADGPEDDPAALRTAPPPFDKASTDVIIRTADHVDVELEVPAGRGLAGVCRHVPIEYFRLRRRGLSASNLAHGAR